MYKESGRDALENLRSFVASIEGTGEGISSKDSVAIRFLDMLERANNLGLKPTANAITSLLYGHIEPGWMLESTERTLRNMAERGWVKEEDGHWSIT